MAYPFLHIGKIKNMGSMVSKYNHNYRQEEISPLPHCSSHHGHGTGHTGRKHTGLINMPIRVFLRGSSPAWGHTFSVPQDNFPYNLLREIIPGGFSGSGNNHIPDAGKKTVCTE